MLETRINEGTNILGSVVQLAKQKAIVDFEDISFHYKVAVKFVPGNFQLSIM